MSSKLNKLTNKIIFGALTPVLLCTSAYADNFYNNRGDFNANMSLGYLSADLKELVYDPDSVNKKLSQLDWKINAAAIIKVQMSYSLLPFLTISANGWTNIPSIANNKMDDYDWEVPGQQSPSEHSWHPDTHLSYAHGLDANLKAWFLNQPNYGLGLLAGYQYNAINLQARGGCYSYHNGEVIGCLPEGQPGIDYTQIHKTPYIGLTAGVKYYQWDLEMEFKYSNWVKVSDTDYHYINHAKYEAKDGRSAYYGITSQVSYLLTNNFKVFLTGAWNRFSEAKSATTILNTATGAIESGGVEGIKQNYYTASLGLSYSL